MSVRKKESKEKKPNGDRIISFFVKKSTGAKQLFRPFFAKNPWSFCSKCKDIRLSFASLSSLKRLLGRRYFCLGICYIFSAFFFRKVCIMDVASLLFREFDQIYTPLLKRMLLFSWLSRVKSRFHLPFHAFLFFLSLFFFFLHTPDFGTHVTRPDQGLLAD